MRTKIIKTLPHLQNRLLTQQPSCGWAENYSLEIEQFARGLNKFDDHTRYSSIISSIVGMTRVNQVQNMLEFAQRGDTITLWPIGYEYPIRVEFWGEKMEQILAINPLTGSKIAKLDMFYMSTIPLHEEIDRRSIHFHLQPQPSADQFTIFTTHQSAAMDLPFEDTDFRYPNLYWSNTDLFKREALRLKEDGFTLHILTRHAELLPPDIIDLFTEWPEDLNEDLPAGFISDRHKIAVFTDRELFGSIFLAQRRVTDDNAQKLLANLEGEIKVGDYVVHNEYGVGKYGGLTQEMVDGQMREYLEVDYAGDDKLLVPIEQLSKLSRYIADGGEPNLAKLSRGNWTSLVERVRKTVMIKAKELVEHYARRELAQATQVSPDDTAEYANFVNNFAFQITHDQAQAIGEIVNDMTIQRPMNRLLVGDVGYGKTEVAMRAAFKMLEAGKQVVVLAPTTILAGQHYEVWKRRFASKQGESTKTDYPVYIFSRWQTAAEVNADLQEVNKGKPAIIVGTHRLFSSGIEFENCGLLIVDEEQKFGVKHKELIRKYNYNIHYLSISATPIPRTLGMALSKLQDISIITTPPAGRKSVHTEIMKQDWNMIREIINRELERDGQVYFVHNEVQTMPTVLHQLQQTLPDIKVVFGHGQMAPAQLEAAMRKFYSGEAKVLLASSIIENGLDMDNVNTMIVNKAHRFGLANLYQLRGRVGRSDRQAYCYLIYDLPTQAANERLLTLAGASHLGAGFEIASRDLELRGAGELLGAQQHGHISKVGYALYMRLLAEEIAKLRAGEHLEKPVYITI